MTLNIKIKLIKQLKHYQKSDANEIFKLYYTNI